MSTLIYIISYLEYWQFLSLLFNRQGNIWVVYDSCSPFFLVSCPFLL